MIIKITFPASVIVLTIVLYGCRTGKAPSPKRYVRNEKLINVKGLEVPELTEERKEFRPSKDLKHDMSNSLLLGRIKDFYSNDHNGYIEAVKHHLIKSTAVNVKSYTYDEVIYDNTYKIKNCKSDIINYNYTVGDILDYISYRKMQITPLKEKV